MDSRLAVSTRTSLWPRRMLSSLPPSAVAQSFHPPVSYPPIASLSHCPMVSSPVVLSPLRPKDASLRCPSTLWPHLTLSHPPITHVLSSRCPITSSPSHHPVPQSPHPPTVLSSLAPTSAPSFQWPIIPSPYHPILHSSSPPGTLSSQRSFISPLHQHPIVAVAHGPISPSLPLSCHPVAQSCHHAVVPLSFCPCPTVPSPHRYMCTYMCSCMFPILLLFSLFLWLSVPFFLNFLPPWMNQRVFNGSILSPSWTLSYSF